MNTASLGHICGNICLFHAFKSKRRGEYREPFGYPHALFLEYRCDCHTAKLIYLYVYVYFLAFTLYFNKIYTTYL